ncbi:MAG: hypothetical protein HQ522_15640 [Bacteroidetes bacterium]|nr:hypothetical protein [Bacteroidota bacterium]
MQNWIIILFAIIIVIEGLNALSLWKIKKLSKTGNKDIESEKYFDLKYKFQLFAAIGTLAVFLVGFLQWNTKEQIKQELKDEFKTIQDSFVVFKTDISNKRSEFNATIEMDKKELDAMSSDVQSLLSEKTEYNKSISSIESQIASMEESIQINPRFHVFTDAKITRTSKDGIDTLMFDDLNKDALGNTLRKFLIPPVVSFFNPKVIYPKSNFKSPPHYHMPVQMMNTTTEYVIFRIANSPFNGSEPNYKISFTVTDISGITSLNN